MDLRYRSVDVLLNHYAALDFGFGSSQMVACVRGLIVCEGSMPKLVRKTWWQKLWLEQ